MNIFFFKSLSREKSTHVEMLRFIKRNELKITQIELLSFFIFKTFNEYIIIIQLNYLAIYQDHLKQTLQLNVLKTLRIFIIYIFSRRIFQLINLITMLYVSK